MKLLRFFFFELQSNIIKIRFYFPSFSIQQSSQSLHYLNYEMNIIKIDLIIKSLLRLNV